MPVAASQSLEEIAPEVDRVVCVEASPALWSIGEWYEDFTQVSDEEVLRFLEDARQRARAASAQPGGASEHR